MDHLFYIEKKNPVDSLVILIHYVKIFVLRTATHNDIDTIYIIISRAMINA
jgi:hypothetical protein